MSDTLASGLRAEAGVTETLSFRHAMPLNASNQEADCELRAVPVSVCGSKTSRAQDPLIASNQEDVSGTNGVTETVKIE